LKLSLLGVITFGISQKTEFIVILFVLKQLLVLLAVTVIVIGNDSTVGVLFK
jgi:hypothetical protein